MITTRTLSILLIIVLIVNMALYALKMINGMVFFMIIILCGMYSFLVLPILRSSKE